MEMFGVSILSLIPMREEPKEQAEMCSQVLFGQGYRVIEEQAKWLKIRIDDDNYEGWIDKKCHRGMSLEQRMLFETSPKEVLSQTITPACSLAGTSLWLPAGSTIITKALEGIPPELCFLNIETPACFNTGDNLASLARSFLHAPYLWGGKSILGIDCSGFTQLLYSLLGVQIPRDASQQYLACKQALSFHEMQVGDLAFFENEQGRIVHVGVVLGKDSIIHASAWVKEEKLSPAGIIDPAGNCTHSLLGVRRLAEL